jgi:hypothetical protein
VHAADLDVCTAGASGTSPSTFDKGGDMFEERHVHEEPVEPESRSGGLVGYAAIKYTAIVVIVLAILGFLAFYLIPLLTRH